MFGNIGGLIATWSFLDFDKPDYKIGNGLNLGTSSGILVIATLFYFWMKWDNRRRENRNIEEELTGLTPHQVQDLDWEHPAFRWRP
jgi:hypothetical protein